MSSRTTKLLCLLCLGLLLTMVFQGFAGARGKRTTGIALEGILAKSQNPTQGWGFVVGVDSQRRLLYYMKREGPRYFLREYDLHSKVPRESREEMMGVWENLRINYASPYTIAIDSERHLMVILGYSPYGSTALRFVDLKTLQLVGSWDLATVLPGFVGQGLHVSERDDRIYIIGSQSGSPFTAENALVKKPAQPTVVVALDAKVKPQEHPQLAWAKAVPQCQHTMDTKGVGALIARSENLPALYFACIRPNPYAGESGLVRLWISKDADQAKSSNFPLDFFPVSGSFTSQTEGVVGVSAFDPERERFFIQSLSAGTPGTWVFDGLLSAWVGFIVSPDNSNKYVGLDTSSGHYYMAGLKKADSTGYIVVSDVSQTPVTQGVVVGGYSPRGFISVDEKTHRLFVEVDLKPMGLYRGKKSNMYGFLVLKDNTTISKPQKPVDYDELTRDVEEGPGIATSFSGSVNGFGSRTLLVGGYGGVVSATGQRPTVGTVRPGDRGLTAARVPSVDLRGAGASASAQALVPDANTEGDLHDAGAGAWPWTPATCLDGGGTAQTNQGEGPNGAAVVQCDLGKNKAEASSYWGGVSADGLSIAASSFAARSSRDSKNGAVTQTLAQARGIEVSVPGGGTLSIARVLASSITVAHGRTGSAAARYERRIVGIELTDAEGKVVQRIGECGGKKDVSCRDAIDELNKALPMKINVALPKPVVAQTPKGAFSGVFLGDGDFIEARTMNNAGSTFKAEAASRAVPALQISIYNDSEEKSRLVTQLAAIEANSIYTNTPITEPEVPKVDVPTPQTDVSSGGGSVSTGSVSSTGPALKSLGGPGSLAASTPIEATPLAAAPLDGALAFLSRSPGSAVLVATVWLTFVSAGAAVFRRRSLLALLVQGSGSN